MSDGQKVQVVIISKHAIGMRAGKGESGKHVLRYEVRNDIFITTAEDELTLTGDDRIIMLDILKFNVFMTVTYPSMLMSWAKLTVLATGVIFVSLVGHNGMSVQMSKQPVDNPQKLCVPRLKQKQILLWELGRRCTTKKFHHNSLSAHHFTWKLDM
jgi:hypothetical protein